MTLPTRLPLLVCAPMRIEARALRANLGPHAVRRTGYGPRRSSRSAAELGRLNFETLAVAGLAGGVGDAVRSGDVVVASEVRGPRGVTPCTSASVLVEALRSQGLTVHCGPIVSTDRLVIGARRAALADAGALAVDLESAALTALAADRPLAVVRVVTDTAREPLLAAAMPRRAVRALRRLRSVGPCLDRWSRSVRALDGRCAEETKEVC
jgi:uridine phosphorylase